MPHIASLLLLLLAPLPVGAIDCSGIWCATGFVCSMATGAPVCTAKAVATTPGPTTTKASLKSMCGGCADGYTCRLDGPGGAPQCVWVSSAGVPKPPSSSSGSSGSSGSSAAPGAQEDGAWRAQATAQADDGPFGGNTLVIIVAAGGVTIFLCCVCAAAYRFSLREGEKNCTKKLPGEVLDHDWGLGQAHVEAGHAKRKHDAAGHPDHEMREHHEIGLGAVVERMSQHHERHQDRRHSKDGRAGSAGPPRGPSRTPPPQSAPSTRSSQGPPSSAKDGRGRLNRNTV